MSVLDIIILVFLVSGLWQGFNHGLMRSLVSLFGWLFAFIFATFFAKPLAPLFTSVVDSPVLSVIAAFIAVALGVIVGLQLILWVMSRTLKGLKLSFVDKLAGAVFAVAKNLMIILLIISVAAPFVKQQNFWQHSQIAPALLPYAPFAVNLSKRLAQDVSNTAGKGIQSLDNLSNKAKQAQATP